MKITTAAAVTAAMPPPATRTGARPPVARWRSSVAGEEVDGAHPVLDPEADRDCERAVLALVAPRSGPTFTRRNGSPRRTGTPTSSPTASAKPSMCAVPPVRTTSPMPSAPGCAW